MIIPQLIIKQIGPRPEPRSGRRAPSTEQAGWSRVYAKLYNKEYHRRNKVKIAQRRKERAEQKLAEPTPLIPRPAVRTNYTAGSLQALSTEKFAKIVQQILSPDSVVSIIPVPTKERYYEN